MADQAAAQPTETVKIPRHRSPNYPSMGLRAAVGRVETLYRNGAMNPLMRVSVLKILGFDKMHGEAGRVLSALKSFGLIEETKDDRIKLSQRAVDIAARQASDPRRTEAIRQAAMSPTIYSEVLEEYSGNLSDGTLKSELIAAKHFNPNAVDGFISDLKDTLEYAGLSAKDAVESDNESDGDEEQRLPKINDYVQWENAGQLQFKEPKRVRAVSEDGKWLFVDGSETGLPIEELTVVDVPQADVPERPPVLPLYPQRIYRMDQLTGGGSRTERREDIFSLAEGTVTIQWPATLSAESFEDVSAWLDILKRKIGRSVVEHKKEDGAQ
ncbi:MAG TPA: hypothetical protein VFR08_04860 [Candidatus Angelobacter sp.]|nr:hypothetical protein [Candidatus Angelobacter sp.]